MLSVLVNVVDVDSSSVVNLMMLNMIMYVCCVVLKIFFWCSSSYRSVIKIGVVIIY